MKHLSVDIETYSSIDIRNSGMYAYASSPNFSVLLFAYSCDFGPVQIVDIAQGEQLPDDIRHALTDNEVQKHAYNAAFEWFCLSRFLQLTETSSLEWISQWRCTMLHGLYCGYPGGLKAVGEAVGIASEKQKLSTGMQLINFFCKPCKTTRTNGGRTRNLPHHDPDKWALFKTYCMNDVYAEMSVDAKLFNFQVPEFIQKEWVLDQIINARGTRVDIGFISAAIGLSDKVTAELTEEAQGLTALSNPNSVAQLMEWIKDQEEDVDNLQKATVTNLIDSTGNIDVKRVLQIRREMGKTSIKKYGRMLDAACADERVRGLLQFYGANRSGRWAGRLVQVQNLPKSYMDSDTLDLARQLVESEKLDTLRYIFGNIPDTLSQLIRTAIIPSEGNKLFVADFSAIEARVIAWLAKEEWRQQVFATHGKIYEASASAMFGVPLEKISKGNPEYELRQKGKVAELALGFQGAAPALIKMGALVMGIPEEELPEIVSKWRGANAKIVDLWAQFEKAAFAAVRGEGIQTFNGVSFLREFDLQNGQDFLIIELPSKRRLYYAKPFLTLNRWGKESIAYWGMDQTKKKWAVQETFGGKLVENVVQAIARDCLMLAIERAEKAGYNVVFHVHDEIVCDNETGDVEALCRLISEPVPWAPNLILDAEGFVAGYYQKN